MSTANESVPAGLGNNKPPPPEITFKNKSSSKRGRWVVAIAILFLVATAVFTGLFVYYYYYYNISNNAGEVASTEEGICYTPDCVIAAASLTKNMNMTADPCEDFSEFACGRYYQEAKLLDGDFVASPFHVLSKANKDVLEEIITEGINRKDPLYIRNMKRFYKSCLDEDKIEKMGLEPFLNDTEFVDDWPTLNPAWNDSDFNLNDVIVRYSTVFVNPLFRYGAYYNPEDHARELEVGAPELDLEWNILLDPSTDNYVQAYQTYLTETAVELGAGEVVAAEDAKAVVDLQTKLAMMIYSGMATSNNAPSSFTTLSKLGAMFPFIDIPGVIKTAFGVDGLILSGNQKILISAAGYLRSLNQQISEFSNRTVQNLFGFTYAMYQVKDLTKQLRKIRAKFMKVLNPYMTEVVLRRETCLSSTSGPFMTGINKQYLARTFSKQSTTYIEEMFDNLKNAFRQTLEENSWMSNTTKEHAYKKIETMKSVIGYPDDYSDDTYVDKFYENYTMVVDNYYANSALLRKLTSIQTLRTMYIAGLIPWTKDLSEINSFYTPAYNEIDVNAGILQPPFFSLTFPHYVNYAAIGTILGHEMIHGFDTRGSQYDAEGWLNNWWQNDDRSEFLNRTQCLVDQYSGFHVEEINKNLDGKKTMQETTADTVGIKQSFRAYKELVKRAGEQPIIPLGMELTQDQIFFLSFAQVWCEKQAVIYLRAYVTQTNHPPGKFRIIGTLQNSEDFANAYNCSRGSYMNPEKKCEVW